MIFSLGLIILYYFIRGVLTPIRILNDVTLSASISNALDTAGTYLALMDTVIPISTLLTVLGVIVSIEVGIFLFKGIMWVIKKIPFIN